MSWEALERNELSNIKSHRLISNTYSHINQCALNPNLYNRTKKNYSSQIFSWMRGFKGVNKENECLIPAQLILLSSSFTKKEPLLAPSITTGAAGGVDHESTLLRAIYEIVERDSVMGIYLTKSLPNKIDLTSIPYKKIQKIVDYMQRYALAVHIFDATTNIGITVFLVLLIDKTGIGPYLSIGSKAGVDIPETLQGDLEDSLLTRPWVRKLGGERKNISKEINNVVDRAQYWFSKPKSNYLHLLLTAKAGGCLPKDITYKSKKLELEESHSKLNKAGYELYYTDVSSDLCRGLNYRVYKAIIPHLQPLYISEKDKIFIKVRLSIIAKYFGQEEVKFNKIPHPFL